MSIAAPVLRIAEALRGDGSSAGALQIRSVSLTSSWGAQPATALLTYVKELAEDESIRDGGVAVNAYLELDYAGRTFYGVCKSDNTIDSSSGKERIIQFEDLRTYLAWDYVFGAWNLVETVIATHPVSGLVSRVKRFRHLLPANYLAGVWTYTSTPYTAAQILNFAFNAPTLGLVWTCLYHPDQTAYPVLRVDAREGKRLDALLAEISDRQGLTFTSDVKLQLRWCRKGELFPGETVVPGALDVQNNYVFPENADQCRIGFTASDQPTRVLVVGSSNLYQCLNLTLAPDWATGWAVFKGDAELFVDRIYSTWIDPDTEVAFNAFPDDPDHSIGYFSARALAQQLTVREFAAHEDAEDPGTGEAFRDYRKFAGRARLDMPCMLYIDQVVFRAFRPPATVTLWGVAVPTAALRLVDVMLAKVTHDEVTGALTADPTAPLESNGYAVIKGHMVLDDLFDGVRADRFRLDRWTALQDLWKKASFQTDDSGDGTQFVLFDAPVIRSENLIEMKDGYAVFKANATIEAATVKASLTFEAERFIWASQNDPATRDLTINESDLRREIVYDVATGNYVEMPYADGQTPQQKAAVLGAVALTRQFTVMQGGFRRYFVAGDVATRLSGFYDRVTVYFGHDGHYEEVDFANERARSAFEPEREYDRNLASRAEFPGQAQLRIRQEQDELMAASLKQSPSFYRSLGEAFRRFIGHADPVVPAQIASGTGTLPVGTPLWRAPMPVAGGSNTQAVMPASSSSTHSVFVGVVPRDAEPADGNLKVQATGQLLVRVKGPVAVRDTVSQSAGHDYLEASIAVASTAPSVGMALQSIPDTSVRLILVQTGGTGGGKAVARWA